MPTTDAGAGLPILFLHTVGDTAFHVPQHILLLVGIELLACDNHLRCTSVLLGTGIVVMSEDILAHIVVAAIEGHSRIVKVYHIGLIVVDTLQHTVLELQLILLRGKRCAITPFPLAMYGSRLTPSVAGDMILCIQFLRVIALPPLLGAIRIEGIAILLGEIAIVVL